MFYQEGQGGEITNSARQLTGFLKRMALQTTPGGFAVVPAHGIAVCTGMGPVARETEHLCARMIIRIPERILRLGNFVFQLDPKLLSK